MAFLLLKARNTHSYVWSTEKTNGAWTYTPVNDWVFNNIVRFK